VHYKNKFILAWNKSNLFDLRTNFVFKYVVINSESET